MKILIVGLSTRAIAQSAVRSSHQVVTVDYFGDRDQRALVENYGLQRDFALPFSATGLVEASSRLDFEAVVYTSNLENHPESVEELARRAILLGNPPSVLRQVRDWQLLRTVCREQGIPSPTTLLPGEEQEAGPLAGPSPQGDLRTTSSPEPVRWLYKPVRSGGGHGIRLWAGERLDEFHVLQACVEGRPASAAFVADGQRCVLLGLTEQLIGRGELQARGFTWCGNILPLELGDPEMEAVIVSVRNMAERLTRFFGLRGVNGLDFVLGRDVAGRQVPYLIEVNPRYTASMELIEWAYGINIFDLHLRSFEGELPSFRLGENVRGSGFYGKGIVYARKRVVMPETAQWEARGRRDIPFPGERIEAHHPVCTVLAEDRTRDGCWSRLLMASNAVRREISGSRLQDARSANTRETKVETQDNAPGVKQPT
jgi:predicted ATP-grasp superfamily ATP-dependent carboligase